MYGKRFFLVVASIALFMAAFAQNARAHDEPVKGTLIGAGIGAAVGGPPGAAVGAVIGAAIGSHIAHESDHGSHAHPHVRREVRYEERRPVAYARPAEYAQPAHARPVRYAYANGNGNGNGEATCEPQTRVVYVEKPKKVVAKQKVKKVCRNVGVREHVAMR